MDHFSYDNFDKATLDRERLRTLKGIVKDDPNFDQDLSIG